MHYCCYMLDYLESKKSFCFFINANHNLSWPSKPFFLKWRSLVALNTRRIVRRFCKGPCPNPTSWTASEAHVIKVNFDAAWLASSGKVGAGLIALNANDEFVGAKCLSFHTKSAIMAEAVAGFEGCKWAYELGLPEQKSSKSGDSKPTTSGHNSPLLETGHKETMTHFLRPFHMLRRATRIWKIQEAKNKRTHGTSFASSVLAEEDKKAQECQDDEKQRHTIFYHRKVLQPSPNRPSFQRFAS
ncbi:hypothetical protein GBA52_019919 [Prunus armeniaca]|nr:hypothetical protein GBA52_019919 [Prunus armeniaca]